MWNTFEAVRSKLNLYDNPHFEEGSGLDDRDRIIDEIEKLEKRMSDEPHPIIKARAIEFVLHNVAIEVNPIDWFGLNFCGWLTWPAAQKAENRSAIRKPIETLNKKWLADITPPDEFNWATQDFVETGVGIFWADFSRMNLFAGLSLRSIEYESENI